jgi:integrase
MPKRRVLEGAEDQERAKRRQQLGSLHSLTLQPATRRRYDKATEDFFSFLRKEKLVLPTKKEQLDPLVCDYLQHLWSTGVGRGQANDTVAGLQDIQPNLRHHLPGAWRLLKTWAVNEIPNRAPPIPEQVVQAMAGWAFFHGHNSFGVSLILGFYTMLRSGELLGLRSSHLLCSPQEKQVLVSLGMTKGGKRQGAAESVILGVEQGVFLTRAWKRVALNGTPLASSPAKWRSLFTESLAALGLERFQYRPYSLRRGGATFWFQKHHNLDRILVQGRWLAHKTARIYINEGLAMMAQTHINFNDPGIRSFLQIYHHTCKTLNFTTLEPPANAGRPGGRGKKVRKRVKIAEFFSPIGLTTVFWVTTNQEVWLGLVVSELNLGSLPLWVWPGGERGFAAGNCRWSIPVIVIFRYLFY